MKKEKKVVNTEEKENKKTLKQEAKKSVNEKRKAAKENIKEEKKRLEHKIDTLVKDKKATKDKDEKKKIAKEIKRIKKQRANIGKKDTYLGDVRKEMSMVRWPSAKEVVKYSVASLVFVAIFALFFYGIDAIFALVKGLFS